MKKAMLIVALGVLGANGFAGITVDGKLPAGNVIVDGIEGDTVYVRQDLSTTDKGGWFYWAFRVQGAAGRTLTFDFKNGYHTSVGPRGPVVTLDRGKTYSYPCDVGGAAKHPKDRFTYAFPKDAHEVWFYECFPYQQAQWDAFLAEHAAKRGRWFETGVLCKSKKGRDVEKARFGCLGRKPKWRMMATCRHHCSESVASYVLEGLCATFLREDELGAWLRENIELMVIPFVDKDGVEEGDQGKNRPPHDHNRDYGAFIHPETKAMTEWARDHAGNNIAIYLDLHCPWIRGKPTNECLYTPFKAPKWYRSSACEKADRRFSQTLERVQCGSFRYKASDDLDYGRFWNTGKNYEQGGPSTWWGITHFTGPVSRCLEVPFQTANGAVVTRETCRDLGRDLAKTARTFLLEEEARKSHETKITFLGDVMCHGAMLKAYRTGRTFDFAEVFAGIIPLLAQSDLVCANLETPIAESNGDLTKERWRFNSPREFACAARVAGIDVAFTANNHCLDRGLRGLAETLRVLDDYGFRHTGTFADRAAAETPLYVEVNGFKLGLLSYTYGSNAWSNREYLKDEDLWQVNFFQRQEVSEPAAQAWMKDRNSPEGRAYAEMEAKRHPENLRLDWYERTEDHARERARLAADVARMRQGNPDLVVMSMHAGGQYNPEATAATKELAEFLFKSGVDVIAGSHEHVVHGSDFSRLAENKLVAYSLGDFDCLHGTWVRPPVRTEGLYPDYSVAWHVYLKRDADGKARITRTDFDVLKIVKGKKDGEIRVVPARDVPGTEADVEAVSRRFTGADASPRCVDGIYPHLAMFNGEGECGTGAVVPWAGSLWAITYGPHCPVGSTDKLYQITPDLKQIVRAESVGGTPANRLVHRETNQLLIGPYVIDAKGNVRVVPPARMPGRLTGAARHLTDPANKVYVATMETGLYELDMRTLDVKTLIRENGKNDGEIARLLKRENMPWPNGWDEAPQTHVPGYHGKGLCSGFGRVFVANNGEDSEAARRDPFVPSGVLADWSTFGRDWRTIRRCQFTDITTKDGIYGNEHPDANPIWSLGWDAKSVILAVTTNGTAWAYYRLPKASHCYDGAHGWNTEWPRIRDVGFDDGTLLGTMHGTFWKVPKEFSPAQPNGIRPLSTYLKVIGDFCRWQDRIVFGCDDQAQNEFLGKRTLKKDAPKRDRSQSNLWFVKPEDLTTFGPPSGEGWVWLNEDVKAGAVSDPYLHAGYDVMDFAFTDADGKAVPHELVVEGDWVRVKALADAKGASAHFVYGPSRPAALPKHAGFVEVHDDHSKKTYRFPNVNGDKTVICREVATERDLLYVGGVFYELPADNAGGFEVLRPIALADEPVRSIEAKLGLVFINGKPMAIDSLWRNGTAAEAYWLWRSLQK